MYLRLYPWQIATMKMKSPLQFRLNKTFDADKLEAEYNSLLSKYRPKGQFDVYHNGKWNGLCLHSKNGDPSDDTGGLGDYRFTPLVKDTPYIKSIIASIPGDKQRVRILIKSPGANIYWHVDQNETVDRGLLRLHVPIVTNNLYEFQMSHEALNWKPGEFWYGDFSFPHRLRNRHPKLENAHLVIDVVPTPEVMNFLGQGFVEFCQNGQADRQRFREKVYPLYNLYNLIFTAKTYYRIIKRKLRNA